MWREENLFENEAIKADVELLGHSAKITLKDSHYSLARLVFHVGEIPPLHYGRVMLDVDKKSPDTDVKIYEIYSSDKGELLRRYLDPEEPTLVPEEATRLDVAVLVRSHSADTVTLGQPRFELMSQYKPRNVKIASVVVEPALAEGIERTAEINLQTAIDKVNEICDKEHPDLVVLSERFLSTGLPKRAYINFGGEEMKRLCEMAKRNNIYFSCSLHEIDDDGCYYNTAPLIDRNGRLVAKYRKTHLTMGELAAGMIPGEKIVTVDTDFGRIGFAICWDLFFPDFMRLVSREMPEIIINPTLGYHYDQNRMRAKDSNAYIVSAGVDGASCAIMAPHGVETLLSDGKQCGYAIANVDLNYRHSWRLLSAPSAANKPNVIKYETNQKIHEKYGK